MPFMNWDDEFSVNIESIDGQHKKIIDLVNELYAHVKNRSSRESMDEALVRLSVYTVKHFIFEERLFKKHGYLHQKKHKKEHDELAERVVEFHRKHTLQQDHIAEERLEHFKNRMCDHIATYDREYINFMSHHGIK